MIWVKVDAHPGSHPGDPGSFPAEIHTNHWCHQEGYRAKSERSYRLSAVEVFTCLRYINVHLLTYLLKRISLYRQAQWHTHAVKQKNI